VDAVWALVVLALFGAILGGLALVAQRVRRSGTGGSDSSMMGPFEELWHPAAVRARIETQAQEERPAPAPSPGDRLV
jgi:hypothetical protein